MKRMMILKLAASTMTVGLTLSGCSLGGINLGLGSASDSVPTAKDGPKYAKKAQKALAKGEIDKAISYAERSVAGAGNVAETRALLGQAYMAAGRLASAERSFQDAMDLGQADARTVLSLAMAQLGQGKAGPAARLVRENRQIIPISDYGLALALAGETKEGVDILVDAIRSDQVDARTRQNLGLAYALDGRWREAKLMAMQDMAPTNVDARIMQWAQMARPGAYDVRVAGMLGVQPDLGDPGQPQRLALNAAVPITPAQDMAAEVASFDSNSAPLPAIGEAPRGALEDAMPMPAPVAKIEPVAVAPSAPVALIKASTAPVRVAPVAKAAAFQKTAATMSPVQGRGTHLVQVGAYNSLEDLRKGWNGLVAKHRDLGKFGYAHSTVQVKGKTYYRLAAVGFGNGAAANAMCAGLKATGSQCIVRDISANSPVRMASSGATKIASR
ncbi:MAG: SPOR domain-containing protein [Parasphingorhabdus sp.]|nr:SPOR domain-containing protein [Parasphingorhabdus sp.]